MSENFGRVLTAMVSPFAETGELDLNAATRLADYLANNGSDTRVVCGTTGESPTLTWDEEYALFQAVRDAVGDRAKVIAGTGSNSTREAISATEKAAKLNLDGSLQVVPYYNKPSQAGLYEHFRAIADCSDMPVLLYNVPGRTGISLQPETVAKLAELPSIVGIKEASGSMDAVSEIRRLSPNEFSIYSGDDSATLPMLALGASGVVSVASHLVGLQLQEMIRSFEKGELGKALNNPFQLFPLVKALFIDTNPAPVKVALNLQGWNVGSVRSPLAPMSNDLQEQLRDVLKTSNLIEPAVVAK
ncbi:MAG: 4-hydroxy-tetrahydrodipicolinate synthase [Cyanobacteria bacterium P01_D01_bin.123]